MANSNSDSDKSKESSVNKRVKMNITMNIELKNSESAKEYQKIVEAVTKNAMACIDAALAPTNSINNGTPTETKEMAKLRRSLDNKNSKHSKNETRNAISSNTTSTVSSGTKKARTGNVTDINTNKRVETEAMKKVRQSLELKNLKSNKYDNPNATGSSCGNISGTKNANYSKETTHTIPKEGKEKPSVETEAMKKIRLILELKNKLKENNATPSTSSLTNSTRTCQIVEDTGNTKSPGTGIKRKVADADKTQIDTVGVKRRKGRNSGRNETTNTTSKITNEQMDISDDTDDENISAPSVTGTGSKNTAQETKRVAEKAGVETEAMKLIRRRLDLKKNKNKNEVASYTTSTTSPPSATRVAKETKKVKSTKAVKRKTAANKPTEEMKIMKERIEQRKTPQRKETSRNTNTTCTKTGHESVPTCNLSPSYTFEITEDESDENPTVYTNEISETTYTDNNKANKRKRSTSSSASDVEQPDNTAATTIRRITRSKSSKTWERRAWTK